MVEGTHEARILVVEDHVDVRQLLSTVLGEAGFFVSSAPDGPTLRSRLAAEMVDLVILDALLPGESGTELASFATSKGIPVLMISGDPNAMETLEHLGHPFLPKPFRIDELLELVRRLLAR